MKAGMAFLTLFGLAAVASAVQVQDRKITEVVKLLQNMLDASQKEGDTERELFGKYKCYCDTNKAEKEALIDRLGQEIALHEAKIEELLAHNGKLSKEVAKLDADMTQNEKDREEATQIRDKEHLDFVAKEADLKQAILQMDGAVQTLAEIGADQTLSTAGDHTQYMVGFKGSLIKLKASLQTALVAASAFVSKKQVEPIESFIQAPFTGTYSARSGEVVGILKSMRDTFKANLAEAREVEARALTAYNKFMGEMLEEHAAMKRSFDTKQGELASNDEDLAAQREQLEAAETTKAEAEDFLATLLEMCAAKKKQYESRVDLRSQEQAALSEAIAILNSDSAFATFGTVSATSSGPDFFQRRSTIRHHRQLHGASAASAAEPMKKALGFLQAAEQVKGSSPLLGRIVLMIQANNPFKVVLAEIEKMIDIIKKEGKADAEQKQWCDKERDETNLGIEDAKGKIQGLNAAIDILSNSIHNPETGLIVQIKTTEDSLQENYDSQVSETKTRKEENVVYQKDIASLQEADALVSQAIKVLSKYYSKITDDVKAPELAQVRDEPAPPSTWEDKYQGQSAAGGTSAVGMLEFILQNTKKEEQQAHNDELMSQHDYEDLMTQLKGEEASLQGSLAGLKKALAEAEEELLMKQEDLAKTEQEKAALEAYLEKIKPGCDFITENLNSRITSRVKETASLKSAATLLKQSPAFKHFTQEQHQEDLGECGGICAKSEDHVDCKACLAKTSVPGYCAGHPQTEGC